MIYEYYHELKFHDNTSGLEFHKNLWKRVILYL